MKLLRIFRQSWWLILPALVLTGGYLWQSGTLRQSWARVSGGPPILEFPAVIDLGERTPNEVIVHRFAVANRGGQDLVIDQVRSTCSCGALDREVNGGYEPVENLRLSPGERAELVVRLTVRTDGAGTFNQAVSFATNDPAHPEGRITLVFRTISGGIRTSPTAVQFGRIPVGRETRQVVDIHDRDPTPQTVARVVSADPDRVAVKWIPATSSDRSDAGVLLGHVEIVPNVARPLLLDTIITVELADPKIQPVTIPVSGRVVPRIEATPESLVLPLTAGGGLVYSGRCVIRGPAGHAPKLKLISASPDLKVELPVSPEGADPIVQVTWLPRTGASRGESRKSVRLRAMIGEQSETIEIPVTCEYPK